jgi:hypothetical protein
MRHRLFGASLLTAVIVLFPAAKAHAQKKKNEKPIDSAQLPAGSEYVGKLKTVPGSDRTFLVTVDFKTLVPIGKINPRTANPNLQPILRTQQQIQEAQNRLARAKTPQQQQQQLQRLYDLQVKLQTQLNQLLLKGLTPPNYKVVSNKRDVELQHVEEDRVKVRTLFLPEQFDDKGNIKKYTAAEKLALKGKDKTLPGYESSLEKLEVGQTVKVKLVAVKKKKSAKADDKEPDEPKEKAKGKKDDDGEKKLQVRLIVIVEEAGSPSSPGDRKKKKND